MDIGVVRFVLRVVLRPFGLTVCRDYLAHWSVRGGTLVRSLHPIGWRIAAIGDDAPMSQTELFLRGRP